MEVLVWLFEDLIARPLMKYWPITAVVVLVGGLWLGRWLNRDAEAEAAVSSAVVPSIDAASSAQLRTEWEEAEARRVVNRRNGIRDGVAFAEQQQRAIEAELRRRRELK